MTAGTILIIIAAVFLALALIGWWMNKRNPEKAKDPDKVLENVADLNDHFNRARYQNEDSGR